ncbi:MAG: hypothetical protein V1709_02145 [Planctomycetota bacterium]
MQEFKCIQQKYSRLSSARMKSGGLTRIDSEGKMPSYNSENT